MQLKWVQDIYKGRTGKNKENGREVHSSSVLSWKIETNKQEVKVTWKKQERIQEKKT